MIKLKIQIQQIQNVHRQAVSELSTSQINRSQLIDPEIIIPKSKSKEGSNRDWLNLLYWVRCIEEVYSKRFPQSEGYKIKQRPFLLFPEFFN